VATSQGTAEIQMNSGATGKLQRLKILIAEDEDVTRLLLEASLTNWGHDALLAPDGEEAKAIMERGGIDVCILDWDMPRIDGVALCRWIRTAPLTPKPHVIMLTSRKDPGYIQLGLEAGANDYIVKPCNRPHLRKLLSAISHEED
jgi:DNA-binding response OmpR family regulator